MMTPTVVETHRLSPYAPTPGCKVALPDLVAASLHAVPKYPKGDEKR